jgi:16S rRNA (cytidine1402-2'-O)-methyltransferase
MAPVSVLYIVATPIGNMEDISYRAVRVLGEVEVLACEDTRQTRKIYERYSIPSPQTILSYHEHNESRVGGRIIACLEKGSRVALCSNAGYPGISDPGYRIISRAREEGIEVQVIPGAGAVTTALLVSGLPTSSYIFKGFAPKKKGRRRSFLEEECDRPHTLIVFESPYRIGAFLRDALDVLGNRMAAVCIELTKKFERIHRAGLAELAEQFHEKQVKGEITVVIAGNNPKFLAG